MQKARTGQAGFFIFAHVAEGGERRTSFSHAKGQCWV